MNYIFNDYNGNFHAGLQIQTLKTSLVRTGWYNRVRSITEYLNSPNLTVGTTGVRFKCSSDLDVTRIEWYREDNLTSTSSSSTAYVNHGMVSTDDEGTEYSCSVISPYANQTKEIILSVMRMYINDNQLAIISGLLQASINVAG